MNFTMNAHNDRLTTRINLGPFPLGPRVAFVDRACTSMIEDRYGPYRTSSLLVAPIRTCHVDDEVLFDISSGSSLGKLDSLRRHDDPTKARAWLTHPDTTTKFSALDLPAALTAHISSFRHFTGASP